MKKICSLLIILTLLSAWFAVPVLSEGSRSLILVTCYRQLGWGERLILGAVDSRGGLWSLELDNRTDLPLKDDAFVEWLETSAGLESEGTLKSSRLFELQSLVAAVPVQEVDCRPAADDAGTQTSLAIRTGKDGREIILLGCSGDSVGENTDPSAQALYRALRSLFPGVPSYDGESLISPRGFQPVSLLTFCGYDGIDLSALTLRVTRTDCEAGPSEAESGLTAEDLMSMTVTGKRNSLSTTGGTLVFSFEDTQGKTVAVFEFDGDLLVMKDGMYSVRQRR